MTTRVLARTVRVANGMTFTDIPCRCCGRTITRLGDHSEESMRSHNFGYCWACWLEGRWAGDGDERYA